LLDRFSEKQAEGRVKSSAYNAIFHLIQKAGKDNWRFERLVSPLIKQAQSAGWDFNPSLQDVLESLIAEIGDAEVYPMANEDAAALSSQKTELAFVRFFLVRLHEGRGVTIPENMDLSNKSISTITRCALNRSKDLPESQISDVRRSCKIFLD
jgi:hypothetical protein